MRPYVGHARALWDLCVGKLASHRSRQKAKDEKRRLEKSGKTRERQRARMEIKETTYENWYMADRVRGVLE